MQLTILQYEPCFATSSCSVFNLETLRFVELVNKSARTSSGSRFLTSVAPLLAIVGSVWHGSLLKQPKALSAVEGVVTQCEN